MKKQTALILGAIFTLMGSCFVVKFFSRLTLDPNIEQPLVKIASSLFKFNQEKKNKLPRNSLLLKTPIIRYTNPGNELSEPIISGYENHEVELDSEFEIKSETLGFQYEKSVGDIKLRLLELGDDWIKVKILADRKLDGQYHPRSEGQTATIEDGSCIQGFPLVMDVSYDYCFRVYNFNELLTIEYFVESKSSMPRPR